MFLVNAGVYIVVKDFNYVSFLLLFSPKRDGDHKCDTAMSYSLMQEFLDTSSLPKILNFIGLQQINSFLDTTANISVLMLLQTNNLFLMLRRVNNHLLMMLLNNTICLMLLWTNNLLLILQLNKHFLTIQSSMILCYQKVSRDTPDQEQS